MLDELVYVDVDLNIAPQCQHKNHLKRTDIHAGNAKYLISVRACCTSKTQQGLICGAAWDFSQERGTVRCVCGSSVPVNWAWRIISVL